MRRRFGSIIAKSCLLVEAFFYLAWSKAIVARSFARVTAGLGEPMSETPFSRSRERSIVIERVSAAVNRASRHTPWKSTCLVRAVAAMKMLERRRMDSTLYLGTAKDAGGRMIAHAWLRSGTWYVTGAKEMEHYAVVGKFANRLERTGVEEADAK
ncbi:lasso peptide biosynthesis B2 protein [Cohnella lubricantis]|uniref:Lasso peptide biosynthesis B2 protein n=1 Tax=Cohnella lubricantis TaxID=2163172 RepID=A0A841T9X2_9BACL|nr:lasso peptide biosynthesis B2 protein [Cohnella lubricantis]MBB6676825.1 lasso peptide biosynthesis B2 protein [Cohnella lubricantis]MBP2119404.1 hypothetical protein [Cohnella lubricantis]